MLMMVLEDHPLVQQGICSLIQMQRKDAEMICTNTIRESMEVLEKNNVDMAFVDICLGRENGLTLLEWVRERKLTTKILVLTSSSRQSDFCRARELGADAYVLKDAFLEEIVCGLHVVERGGKFYSTALVEQMGRGLEQQDSVTALTRREKEIFLLLAEGASNAQISRALYISEGTTKKHITSIFSKLHLQSRVEAALLASRMNAGSA